MKYEDKVVAVLEYVARRVADNAHDSVHDCTDYGVTDGCDMVTWLLSNYKDYSNERELAQAALSCGLDTMVREELHHLLRTAEVHHWLRTA